ncbi:MAG: primosomal protein N', partial [Oscillospiraceae bacterium]|nr:primosomal protein N' [Oscillospiraceae bacterium]
AFVRERSFSTFYDAIRAMLPAGLWYAREGSYQVTELPANAFEKLESHPAASSVLRTILELGGSVKETQLRKLYDAAILSEALQELTRRKYLSTQMDLERRTRDKTEKLVSLTVSAEEALEYAAKKRRSAALQASVLDLLAVLGVCSAKELCYYTGANNGTLNRLEKLGYVSFTQEEVFRRPEIRPDPAMTAPIVLTSEQQQVYDALERQMLGENPGYALLHGVTGSGKTMIYLRLIETALARGRSAMLLVPEIALTPQLLSTVSARFGDQVAVLHSSLRVGERYDEWKRIRAGLARVVIGTRSAVFAPAEDLGIIIVDEEQEHSYKSENAPRYHAREVAQYRGRQSGALVLLGSATPSVESMYRARTGAFSLLTLPARYNGRALPPVQIVDMKQELKNGNAGAISAPLREALETCIREKHQAILFLNRRGASRMVMCVDCGDVPECPRCSVHMTYHAANGRLMCHYCGHSEPLPARCPHCGGPYKMVGTGTQRVQMELESLFPGVRTERMDADTITATNSHEAILTRFREERIPILIGTQMVAKGLNFENVTLVGVLDADLSLYMDSFRAAETSFSMLTQVVGRSGRGAEEGTAIVQTMTPESTVIRLAAEQDYDAFYETEIALRELRRCPPYSDLVVVTFAGALEQDVAQGAVRFREHLSAALRQEPYRTLQMQILGPAPAVVARVNNVYRYRLTLNVRCDRPARQLIAALLRDFARDKESRGVTAFADLNPYD